MYFDGSLFDCQFDADAGFGARFTSAEWYKPDAEWVFTPFVLKRGLGPQAIVHFFLWDTHFYRLEPPERFVEFLRQVKDAGVRYVCQTDFSCWYFHAEQRRVNLQKNFEYLQLIQEAGLHAILNFNTIWADQFEFYRTALPKKIDAVVFDFNHNEKGYAHIETVTLRKFLDLCDLRFFFVITGKKRMPPEYGEFFGLLKKRRVRVVFIPTEYRKLAAKKKRFYSKAPAVAAKS